MADDHDDKAFRELMADVEPLKSESEHVLKRASEITPGVLMRRAQAEAKKDPFGNFLSTTDMPMIDPHVEVSFKRSGVQHGVFKRLRLGDYQFDGRLDLHGYTLEKAREAVFNFVRDCHRHDIRAALISHGKGVGRNPPALLKSCVAFWLPQFEQVLAYHSAPRHLGGMGATCFLLKKSEKARQKNFEIHSKRR